MTPLLNLEQRWECPHCTQGALTRGPRPQTPFHACKGLKGLSAPLISEGSGARVFTVEREDYIGADVVQLDGERRPVMSVVTERPDGSNDTAVLALVASASVRSPDQ